MKPQSHLLRAKSGLIALPVMAVAMKLKCIGFCHNSCLTGLRELATKVFYKKL